MYYSPVRRSPPEVLPLDLHVLGLPPAFNLSHDQTLQFNLTWDFVKESRNLAQKLVNRGFITA